MREHLESLPASQLPWRTGLIGCLLPILIICCVTFGIAAFDHSLAQDIADSSRGSFLKWTEGMTVRGINIPILLLALYLAWETFRFGWRWADEIAVEATDVGLVPHRSTLMRPIPWREVYDVKFATDRKAHSLFIRLHDGSTKIIRGVSKDEITCEKFEAHVREKARMAE